MQVTCNIRAGVESASVKSTSNNVMCGAGDTVESGRGSAANGDAFTAHAGTH
jgi:hypothetical protein